MTHKETAAKPANQPNKINKAWNELAQAVAGVTRLTFLSATGIAAYVLFFSSNSLTLKVVAGVLAVKTAVDALALSTKR